MRGVLIIARWKADKLDYVAWAPTNRLNLFSTLQRVFANQTYTEILEYYPGETAWSGGVSKRIKYWEEQLKLP